MSPFVADLLLFVFAVGSAIGAGVSVGYLHWWIANKQPRTMHVGHITESWGDRFGWEAGCKCGWRGPLREQDRQAIQDLRGHRTGGGEQGGA